MQYKTRPMVLVKELEKLSERYANTVNATNEAAYWRENIRFPNVSNIGYINKYRSRQHLVLLMALDISCSDDVMDFLGAQLESFYSLQIQWLFNRRHMSNALLNGL